VIVETCQAFSNSSTSVYNAALTAVQLSTADVTTAAPSHPPANKFSLPKLRRAKAK
jgi:hypothetical protein